MKAASQGVPVVYEEYETMPHCFAMVLESLPGSRLFFTNWTSFMSKAVASPGEIKTLGKKIKAKSLEEISVDVGTLSPYNHGEVLGRMKDRVKQTSEKQPHSMSKL
jgi:hypothetical protein